MDMIVTARVCRYDRHEYNRGEIIRGVAPNHATVLQVTGKAEPHTVPVGHVASTARPEPSGLQAEATPDPAHQPKAEGEPAAAPKTETEPDQAPSRGRYRRRDMRAEDGE